MSIAQQIAPHLPYLRRYARALTGSQKSGDAAVIAVLEALIADNVSLDRSLSSRVALYKVFMSLWRTLPSLGNVRGPPELPQSRNLKP